MPEPLDPTSATRAVPARKSDTEVGKLRLLFLVSGRNPAEGNITLKPRQRECPEVRLPGLSVGKKLLDMQHRARALEKGGNVLGDVRRE